MNFYMFNELKNIWEVWHLEQGSVHATFVTCYFKQEDAVEYCRIYPNG